VTALAASLLITLYLLVPSSLFRLFFGFFVPLRSFARTRGEELFQAVASVFIPICLTSILVWTVSPFKRYPLGFIDTTQARSADYKLVASALYSEAIFKENGDAFWKALNRTELRQGRFLIWYYFFVLIEGVLVGVLSISYPMLAGSRSYKVAAKHVLLPNISAWHLLLTPFFFQDKRTVVWVDILCADDTLYQGRVIDHSVDKEGQLAGIIVTDAKRYDRQAYLKEKEKSTSGVNKNEYWRSIPGAKLYLFADKILNLNLSYEGPQPSLSLMAALLSRLLKQTIAVEMKPSSEKPAKP
jgi:hypothetical protein